MSTLTYAVADSATMLRRRLRHMLRDASMTLMLIGMPIVLLLLFVYVFGGTLGAGLGGPSGGRAEYLDFVVPGILLIRRGHGGHRDGDLGGHGHDRGHHRPVPDHGHLPALGADGHVLGSMTQTMLSLAVVTGVALLIGFRPSATPVEWVAAAGVLAMITFALTWLCVAFGLVAKTVEAASNLPQPLVFLPFLGSGFVPTDSMPTGLRWFAEYQPFTPFIDTVRGLLLGTAIGNSATISIAWCVAITVASYVWARTLFNRDPVR
jgi:ABC-2 type transport system permease protein